METQTGYADTSIVQKLPTLPEGKSRHFFVSYSSEERDKVIKYIDELEHRFSVKCLYSDRDFQPGKDITANIKEGMTMSVKVLLFVSPSFLQSGWCKYETDAAFVTSMGCGYSCIVPVLLEECELPPTLVTLTYIDGTIPGVDIPSKIASSLLRPETDDGILGLNMKEWSKMYENGYCYVINGEREPLLSIRPAKYKFTVKQNVINCLKLNKVSIHRKLLKTAFGVINNHMAMRCLDFRNRCYIFVWLMLIILPIDVSVFLIAYTVLEIQVSTRNSSFSDGNGGNTVSTVLNALLIVEIVAIVCLVIYIQKALDISLQTQLWKETGEQCIKHNVLLLFSSRKNKLPTLTVMRYNVSRCKEYLIGIIQSKDLSIINEEMTAERYADILFQDKLAEMTKTLADDFGSLPDAPSNRHNVKGGKMCICQLLEQSLIERH